MCLFILIVTALIVNTECVGFENNKKCCGEGEYLNITNSHVFYCAEDKIKRLGIRTNYTNFLIDHSSGACIDITSDGFFRFDFANGRISNQVPLREKHFSKCCPLGYNYNRTIHGCEENIDRDDDYITETFVKVGLAQCKLIVDEQIEEIPEDLDPKNDSYCIDQDRNKKLIKRTCQSNVTDVCDKLRCIKKCCPDGKSFVGGSNCLDTYVHGLELSFAEQIEQPLDPFAVISNRTCPRIYIVRPEKVVFNLFTNGTFRYWKNVSNEFEYEPVEYQNSYCIEHSTRPAKGYYIFKCFKNQPIKDKFVYTRWLKIITCVFLAITIVMYFFLDETRNVFGKILINYCFGTLNLFSLLVYASYDLGPTDKNCKIIGYSLTFLSCVSFAWLNIMCWDIWFTFGCTKKSIGAHQRRRDIKRFCLYLLYGYGVPILLTLNVYIFASAVILHQSIQPYVGRSLCFIEPRYAIILFLRLPHLIMQCVNVVLFFKTINYCLKVKKEINKINDTTTHERQHRFKQDKERLFLILKLSVIMGFTFIFETISGFVDMSQMGVVLKYTEIVWDSINALQGVFIFIIFICKKKTYRTICRKLNLMPPRLQNNQSTITSTTRMSEKNVKSLNGRFH